MKYVLLLTMCDELHEFSMFLYNATWSSIFDPYFKNLNCRQKCIKDLDDSEILLEWLHVSYNDTMSLVTGSTDGREKMDIWFKNIWETMRGSKGLQTNRMA